ncbi:MAG: hypothetical protein GQ574_02285 [Crocinitomix sp.]|nr:hypothetical protein [Crocinitomix sp.]
MKNQIKSLSILIMVLMTSSTSFSQDVKIENGSQFKVTSLESIKTIIDVKDDQSSFLTSSGLLGKKFRVLNLDGSLDIKSKFEIETPKINNKKVKYIGSEKFGPSTFFFSRFFDRKADSYTLYASELDPNTGKFLKNYEAAQVNDDKFGAFSNPFSTYTSIDSTKMLILTTYPTKRNENVRYGLKVVNPDMSTVWSKDIEFGEADKDFRLTDVEIDRAGNIHMIATLRMSREEKKEKDSKSRYYTNVYSYFHETGELKQYEIGFSDYIIRSIDLDVNDKDELIGMGFYSDKKFQLVDSYKGFFFIKIDPRTKEVVATNVSPFSEELIEELAGKRKAKKGKFPPYVVRKSIPLDNGGYAVVAEHYVYTQSTSTSASGAQTTTESWLYGNVVVMYMSPEGKMETASVIKKKQYCTAKNGGASFLQLLGFGLYPGVNELPYYGISIIENNSNIYILYNANPKNEQRVKDGKNPKSVRQRNSVTMLATFKPDGSVFGDVLFKSKDASAGVKMPLMPQSYVQYSDNAAIIFGRKGKKMRATRITIG